MTLQGEDAGGEALRTRLRNGLSELFCCNAAGDARGVERCALGMLGGVRMSAALDAPAVFKKCDIVSLFVSITSAAAAIAGERGRIICAFSSPPSGIEIRCCPELVEQSLLVLLANGVGRRSIMDIRLAAGSRTVSVSADTDRIGRDSMERRLLQKTAAVHRGRVMTSYSGGEEKTVLVLGRLGGCTGLAGYDIPSPASLMTDKYSPVVSALGAVLGGQ